MSLPMPHTQHFSTALRGSIFGRRAEIARRLQTGDTLVLIPDPPGVDEPAVWVHVRGGDVVGHLAPDVNAWLVPWLLEGGRCHATVAKVNSEETASWKRIILDVQCFAAPPRRPRAED